MSFSFVLVGTKNLKYLSLRGDTHTQLSFLFSESVLDPFSGVSEIDDFDPLTLGSSDFLLDRAGPGSGSDPFSLPIDSFISLSPPHTQDYHFGLEDHEGISELFDCDFTDLGPLF